MNTHFASKDLTAGQLNALVKQLGGPDIVRQYLRGNGLVVKEAPPKFEILCSIEVGTFTDGKAMRDQLKTLPYQFTDTLRDQLYRLSHEYRSRKDCTPRTIDLVAIRCAEMLPESTELHRWHRFLTAVEDAGYKVCPPDTALQMMVQCPDVFETCGWMSILSETKRFSDYDSSGRPTIFAGAYAGVTFAPNANDLEDDYGHHPIVTDFNHNDAMGFACTNDTTQYIFMAA